MQSKEENGIIIVRLFANEDVMQSLKTVCRKHNIETAVVITAIGQLKNFTLGYFKEKGNYTPREYPTPHELLSINGIISREADDYKFHLHATLGNEAKQAIGGHLIRGMVEVTNEIILMKSNIKVKRKLDDATGLTGLVLEE